MREARRKHPQTISRYGLPVAKLKAQNMNELVQSSKTCRQCIFVLLQIFVVLFALQPLTGSAETNAPRRALVVGVANYDGFSKLKNPLNDASDIASSLETTGSFKVTLVTDAGRKELRAAIDAFSASAKDSEVVLFYFSGHGLSTSCDVFMIAQDDEPQRLSEDLSGLVSLRYLLERLAFKRADYQQDRKAHSTIVILDSDLENPFSPRTRSLGAAQSCPRGDSLLPAVPETFIAFTTQFGEVAFDSAAPGDRNSPFTKHLLRAMQQPNLSIEEVFKEVRGGVVKGTKGRQVPWERTSLTGFFAFRR